jgi:hypothetical protein
MRAGLTRRGVVGQDREVGQLAWLDRAFHVLLLAGVGGAVGIGAHRLRRGDGFRLVEGRAAAGTAIGALDQQQVWVGHGAILARQPYMP